MSDLNTVLEALHELTASQLADHIKNGIPVVNKETGEVVRIPAPASYYAVAVSLLKHNGIQAKASKKNGLGKLANVIDLPIGDPVRDLLNGTDGNPH